MSMNAEMGGQVLFLICKGPIFTTRVYSPGLYDKLLSARMNVIKIRKAPDPPWN